LIGKNLAAAQNRQFCTAGATASNRNGRARQGFSLSPELDRDAAPPAVVQSLVEQITDGRAKRPRQNEGSPEQENARRTRPDIERSQTAEIASKGKVGRETVIRRREETAHKAARG
jgi:hypothetical protein